MKDRQREMREIKEAFADIHAEEELKNATKTYLSEKMKEMARQEEQSSAEDSKARRQKGSRERLRDSQELYGRNKWMRRLAPVLACFLFLVVLSGGSYTFFSSAAVISVDVNPSIELSINRFDRVIDVEGYNADGEELADSLSVRFMNYVDAVETLMDSDSFRQYLTEDADISIAVVADDEEKGERMLSDVKTCTAGHNAHCFRAEEGEVENAHEAGLSYGKYQAYLELKELDPDITTEDIRGMTMREIRDRIAALTGEEKATPDDQSQNQNQSQNRNQGQSRNQNQGSGHRDDNAGHHGGAGKHHQGGRH